MTTFALKHFKEQNTSRSSERHEHASVGFLKEPNVQSNEKKGFPYEQICAPTRESA